MVSPTGSECGLEGAGPSGKLGEPVELRGAAHLHGHHPGTPPEFKVTTNASGEAVSYNAGGLALGHVELSIHSVCTL